MIGHRIILKDPHMSHFQHHYLGVLTGMYCTKEKRDTCSWTHAGSGIYYKWAII